MSLSDALSISCYLAGAYFFLGGTVALLRFPDLFSRLHALTKADNLGLGLVVLGLVFQSASAAVVLKLALIWALAIFASSTACYAIGRHALESRSSGEEVDGA